MALSQESRKLLHQCVKAYHKLSKHIDLEQECADFYLLQLLTHLRAQEAAEDEFSRSKQARWQHAADQLARHTDRLDRLFIGYLTVSCLGEGRYGWPQHREHPYFKLVNCAHPTHTTADMDATANRSTVYKQAFSLSAVKLEHALYQVRDLFHNRNWDASIGGKAWGQIADTVIARLEQHYSPTVFVDRVFDLEHNGGCCFDKSTHIQADNLRLVLDEKARAIQPDDYTYCLFKADAAIVKQLEPLAPKLQPRRALFQKLKSLRNEISPHCPECTRAVQCWYNEGIMQHIKECH